MGFTDFFSKKKAIPLLTNDDAEELRKLEREAYMEEARKIMKLRGSEKAKRELTLKKEGDKWQGQI